jgi:ferredoxin-NADP reductase
MPELKAVLASRITRTPTVESFRFLPRQSFGFIPGQFLQVIFDEKNRQNSQLNKYLSFSSGPDKEYIEVTKRLSDSQFSLSLKGLKAGTEVLLKAPLGSCVFEERYRKVAFLIGGIGITPVISIIGHIVDKGLGTDVMLAYSNRSEEETAFKKELGSWSRENKNIKVRYIITECRPEDSGCAPARLDREFLEKYIPDLKERMVFIFGPPKMVQAMEVLALDLGAKKESIKTERFVGY